MGSCCIHGNISVLGFAGCSSVAGAVEAPAGSAATRPPTMPARAADNLQSGTQQSSSAAVPRGDSGHVRDSSRDRSEEAASSSTVQQPSQHHEVSYVTPLSDEHLGSGNKGFWLAESTLLPAERPSTVCMRPASRQLMYSCMACSVLALCQWRSATGRSQ